MVLEQHSTLLYNFHVFQNCSVFFSLVSFVISKDDMKINGVSAMYELPCTKE